MAWHRNAAHSTYNTWYVRNHQTWPGEVRCDVNGLITYGGAMNIQRRLSLGGEMMGNSTPAKQHVKIIGTPNDKGHMDIGYIVNYGKPDGSIVSKRLSCEVTSIQISTPSTGSSVCGTYVKTAFARIHSHITTITASRLVEINDSP